LAAQYPGLQHIGKRAETACETGRIALPYGLYGGVKQAVRQAKGAAAVRPHRPYKDFSNTGALRKAARPKACRAFTPEPVRRPEQGNKMEVHVGKRHLHHKQS
jgi:hypothetical protein